MHAFYMSIYNTETTINATNSNQLPAPVISDRVLHLGSGADMHMGSIVGMHLSSGIGVNVNSDMSTSMTSGVGISKGVTSGIDMGTAVTSCVDLKARAFMETGTRTGLKA